MEINAKIIHPDMPSKIDEKCLSCNRRTPESEMTSRYSLKICKKCSHLTDIIKSKKSREELGKIK